MLLKNDPPIEMQNKRLLKKHVQISTRHIFCYEFNIAIPDLYNWLEFHPPNLISIQMAGVMRIKSETFLEYSFNEIRKIG